MRNVLIVIPTYNESESIRGLLERLGSARKLISDQYKIDILIVDDSSPDKTAEIVKSLNIDGLSVLTRKEKNGLGPAYLAGFKRGLSLIHI